MFEGVVYHCGLIDGTNPARPRLEVEAVLRPGDADQGPLLLSVAEYVTFAGGINRARVGLDELRQAGRIVDHLGAAHVSFAFWTPIDIETPP